MSEVLEHGERLEVSSHGQAPGTRLEQGGAPRLLVHDYRDIRALSERLCQGLEPEDLVAQSMADTSPTKWHLAHTSWFFENFLLAGQDSDYELFHPKYSFLFNSYYNAFGERHDRPLRGVLTRPPLREILEYRAHVDRGVETLLARQDRPEADRQHWREIVRVGLHHEQQHQELILTDLKHLFSLNALNPQYRDPLPGVATSLIADGGGWLEFEGGVEEIGQSAESGQRDRDLDRGEHTAFTFDNERPRHRVFLEPYAVADRLVTNADYLAFIEDGGYRCAALWLDRGWATVNARGWAHPLYWRPIDGGFAEFTLAGVRDFVGDEPVSHLSLFEADAFARWAGARLPSEAEWEHAANRHADAGSFADDGRFHPSPVPQPNGRMRQALGDCWEWTSSSYGPYPGYRAEPGALGEYNGKFMCEQNVLRGGSCATSRSHIRTTYRNFFYAPDRWQFSGLRLAKDL